MLKLSKGHAMGAVAVTAGIFAFANPAQAAVNVVGAADANRALVQNGISLSPEEKAAASVVIIPGSRPVTATLTPAGCGEAECQAVVTAQPTAGAPSTGTGTASAATVIPMGDVVVNSAIEGAAPASSLAATAARHRGRIIARKADSAAGSYYLDIDPPDGVCSGLGCQAWGFWMDSRAVANRTYAWVSSRFKLAGFHTCWDQNFGYTLEQRSCTSVNDPSINDLYNHEDYKVNVVAKWFPGGKSYIINRHFTADFRSWVVVMP